SEYEYVEVVVSCRTSAQQVGDFHLHCTGRAVFFTGHAVPAFIEGHVGLLRGRVDRQQVHRAYLDAYGAALVGDALVLVHCDRCAGAEKTFLGLIGHFTNSSEPVAPVMSCMPAAAEPRLPHAASVFTRSRS